MILADSNVIIATLDHGHIHHVASFALMEDLSDSICLPTHGLTEAYNHLSRLRPDGQSTAPEVVVAMLMALTSGKVCRALTHDESFAAVLRFAKLGGRGARLYDYLIGRVALLEGADTIATWNTRHFIPLFPTLRVATPQELLES